MKFDSWELGGLGELTERSVLAHIYRFVLFALLTSPWKPIIGLLFSHTMLFLYYILKTTIFNQYYTFLLKKCDILN